MNMMLVKKLQKWSCLSISCHNHSLTLTLTLILSPLMICVHSVCVDAQWACENTSPLTLTLTLSLTF